MAAAAAAQYGAATTHNRKQVEFCGGLPGLPGMKVVTLTVTTNASYTGAAGDDLDLSAYIPNKIVGFAFSNVSSDGVNLGRFAPGTDGAPASCKLFSFTALNTPGGNSKSFALTVWGY
jgi:hypothetical protein